MPSGGWRKCAAIIAVSICGRKSTVVHRKDQDWCSAWTAAGLAEASHTGFTRLPLPRNSGFCGVARCSMEPILPAAGIHRTIERREHCDNGAGRTRAFWLVRRLPSRNCDQPGRSRHPGSTHAPSCRIADGAPARSSQVVAIAVAGRFQASQSNQPAMDMFSAFHRMPWTKATW